MPAPIAFSSCNWSFNLHAAPALAGRRMASAAGRVLASLEPARCCGNASHCCASCCAAGDELLACRAGKLPRLADGFDSDSLRAAPTCSAPALAFVLASMYWSGCRHPRSLFVAPLRPATGLVRWLSRFCVQEQVDEVSSCSSAWSWRSSTSIALRTHSCCDFRPWQHATIEACCCCGIYSESRKASIYMKVAALLPVDTKNQGLAFAVDLKRRIGETSVARLLLF